MIRVVIALLTTASLAIAQKDKIAQLFEVAVSEQQRGDFASAVRDYEQILKIDSGLVDARANLAVSLVHLNRFPEAIAQYEEALKTTPDNTAIRRNLALAFYKEGNFREAASEFERLHRAAPGDPPMATLLGDCYSHLNEDVRTISMLRPLAAKYPGDADLTYVLASALLRTGATELKAGDKPRALENLQEAVKLNPKLPGLYTQLGIAKEGSGNPQGAEADFRKALELNPDDFDANVHLGGVLYTRRDLDQARTYIERAYRLNPTSNFVIYEMALLKNASGHTEQAVADLEQVERRDPNWLDPHVQLAALYYKVHRPADGLRERQIVARLTATQQK
jgi:tetratricopeptide (TPR) repeat protein